MGLSGDLLPTKSIPRCQRRPLPARGLSHNAACSCARRQHETRGLQRRASPNDTLQFACFRENLVGCAVRPTRSNHHTVLGLLTTDGYSLPC